MPRPSPRALRLRQALAAVPRRGRGRPYPEALRREVVEFARQERAGGRSMRATAAELGIPAETLVRWLSAASERAVAPFRPVQVAGERGPEEVALRGGPVVHAPGGVRIEGLTVEQVCALLRGLAS